MKNYPFKETQVSENVYRRVFSPETKDDELIWHRDAEDRKIYVVESTGWKFQHDDSLPVDLTPGDVISVEKEQWHRVIKGEGPLVVEVHKRANDMIKITLGELRERISEAKKKSKKKRPSGWLPATPKNLDLDKPFTADSWITNTTGVPVNVLVKNYLSSMGLLDEDED
jgi:hypothetical protein|tara:strand:+ start:4673 stop:5179 length:507 start_codon:yes stop_codon:yes gene_type:complete